MNDEPRSGDEAIREGYNPDGRQEPAAGIADTPDLQTEEGLRQGGFLNYLKRHPKGFWFFFWGEFAERCSYYGMRAILAKYMVDRLGIGQDDAGTYMSLFIAACYFLPLVGGYVADNFIGKYWTIVGFSIPYILGHVILGIENYTCLVIALTLLAMGSGVIKPNISTLMGLTYDQQRPGETKLRADAFAIFYFSINVGAALSQFAMPPIRSAYGYAIAFMFPAALMVLAFFFFAAGKKYYGIETIERKQKTPEERAEQWRILGRIFGLFFLVMFFWAIFDQAASTWIFFTEACMNRHILGYEMDADQMQFFNPVLILILLPPITVLWRVLSKRGIEVRATDKMIIGFVLTAGCMGVMALAAWLAGAAELRPAFIDAPAGMELTLTVAGEPPLVISAGSEPDSKLRTTAGASGVVSVVIEKNGQEEKLSFTGPSVVKLVAEGERRVRIDGAHKLERGSDGQTTLLREGDLQATIEGTLTMTESWFVNPDRQVTVWWLVLAYIVITVAEVLISVTGLELAYTAAPKHMTSFVTACWLLTVFLANFLINAPITRFYTQMQPIAYFGMLTGIMVVVSVAFVFVARRFNAAQGEPGATVPS